MSENQEYSTHFTFL